MSIDIHQYNAEQLSTEPTPPLKRKVLLVANTAWYLFNFRRSLIRHLQEQGYWVSAVCPTDRYAAKLEAIGVRHLQWQVNRASMSPMDGFRATRELSRIYRAERPHLVHHFTIKPILFGTTAARWVGIHRIINSVTGLGHVFLSKSVKARMARPLVRRWYVWSLTTRGVTAIFQNNDDLEELSRSSRPLADDAILTGGSGIDLQRFVPSNYELCSRESGKRVLFASRLLREKGISEFIEASRICSEHGQNYRFVVCGEPDQGNPSSVSHSELDAWRKEGVVDLLGHVDDIEREMCQADIVVLPSYREGTPRVLLEAAAMGKPIVATDVPGCREVVVHGENGFLVPPRDSVALAGAIDDLLSDESRCRQFGDSGRRRVLDTFDDRKVNAQTIAEYDKRIAPTDSQNPQGAKAELPRGVFTISLDLELAWGTRGRPAAKHVAPFLDGTREAIRGLLKLFDQYEISATWAIVGALLLSSHRKNKRHPWLTDESFDDIPAGNALSQPHWYAEDILEWLRDHPVEQEIACHTLTHRFVEPSNAGRSAFRADLKMFRDLFDELYLQQPTTFIFPKAHMGHFDILAEMGFRAFRGPESKWFESLPGTILPAALRLADAKMAVRPNVGRPELLSEGLWMIPSSQFYSPVMSVGRHVSFKARVDKAIKGLNAAAESKKVFHLWTHPFNLGARTDEMLAGLDEVFRCARQMCDDGILDILPIRSVASTPQIVKQQQVTSFSS